VVPQSLTDQQRKLFQELAKSLDGADATGRKNGKGVFGGFRKS
jgi:hypothetical protein